ncbi:MAG: hypothetical protein ABL901_07925 [Hyphomicrobiaceae bacterium]
MPKYDAAAASGANTTDMATPATPDVELPTPSLTATSAIGDAGAATVTALADDLNYTLTVGQALEAFAVAHRKVPSPRSMQRYCIDGRIAAQKIRTTYGSEWLINSGSLNRLIDSEPVITVVASDAANTGMAAPATPIPQQSPVVASVTAAIGDGGGAGFPEMAAPAGERRSIADVLIENSRLVAQVEGKDAIIAELKEDRSFLREEVREARKTRDDVKNIAERMLDTLKTMAIGRLAALSSAPERMDTFNAPITPQE